MFVRRLLLGVAVPHMLSVALPGKHRTRRFSKTLLEEGIAEIKVLSSLGQRDMIFGYVVVIGPI